MNHNPIYIRQNEIVKSFYVSIFRLALAVGLLICSLLFGGVTFSASKIRALSFPFRVSGESQVSAFDDSITTCFETPHFLTSSFSFFHSSGTTDIGWSKY